MLIKFEPGNTNSEKPLMSRVIKTDDIAPTLDALAKYIARRFKSFGMDLNYEQTDKNEVEFNYDDDIWFSIEYIPRMYCEIRVPYYNYALQGEIRHMINPLMWGPLSDAKNPRGYCAPILSFDEGDESFLIYNTYDPEGFLKNMLEQHFSGVRPLQNVGIFYPDFDVEKYNKVYKYGEYLPYDSELTEDIVDMMSESELAFYIWYERETLKQLAKIGPLSEQVKKRARYIEAYFLNKASTKYGVDANKPSVTYHKPTEDSEEWYKWWAKAFEKYEEEHEEEYMQWCNEAEIGKPFPYRPKGDYTEYLSNKNN